MSRRRRRNPPSPDRPKRSLPDILYPTLDLHGRTEAGAERAAEDWLAARRSAGDRTVRLVTGRGLHSVGPPVLPRAIEVLLRRLKGTLVRDFDREPGGGAFRIELTRFPPQMSPTLERPTQLDPELVRRAQEALSELGVEPTPPLIEAEVRRIVKERNRETN
jgi:hypothetical protein